MSAARSRARASELVLRLLLGAFFVYASLDKIASPAAFAKVVYQWQVGGAGALQPRRGDAAVGRARWRALLLIVGAWRREAALVIALLLVVFLAAAGSVMARGIDVENCGCVSVAANAAPSAWPPAWTKGVGWFLVARNLVLLARRWRSCSGNGRAGCASGGRSAAAPPGPPEAGA